MKSKREPWPLRRMPQQETLLCCAVFSYVFGAMLPCPELLGQRGLGGNIFGNVMDIVLRYLATTSHLLQPGSSESSTCPP